jgi:integrase
MVSKDIQIKPKKGEHGMEYVQPIRDRKQIDLIKKVLLGQNERDYVQFTLGINSGLRISDLLPLEAADVSKDRIKVREGKTGKKKDFPVSACLVFLLRVPPDTAKAAWKQLVKSADLVEFSRLTDKELITQISKACKRQECTISSDDALFLIQYSGSDMETLSGEVVKACSHAGAGNAVTRSDIEAVCIQTQESKVFHFSD